MSTHTYGGLDIALAGRPPPDVFFNVNPAREGRRLPPTLHNVPAPADDDEGMPPTLLDNVAAPDDTVPAPASREEPTLEAPEQPPAVEQRLAAPLQIVERRLPDGRVELSVAMPASRVFNLPTGPLVGKGNYQGFVVNSWQDSRGKVLPGYTRRDCIYWYNNRRVREEVAERTKAVQEQSLRRQQRARHQLTKKLLHDASVLDNKVIRENAAEEKDQEIARLCDMYTGVKRPRLQDVISCLAPRRREQ